KMHALSEIHDITLFSGIRSSEQRREFTDSLQKRLDILGSSAQNDKQYLLSLRRAVLSLSGDSEEVREYIAQMYLTSSKLARKAGHIRQSFDAVLKATKLGSKLATVEHARLLWHEGEHRKAIQSLKGAIAAQIVGRESQARSTQSRVSQA